MVATLWQPTGCVNGRQTGPARAVAVRVGRPSGSPSCMETCTVTEVEVTSQAERRALWRAAIRDAVTHGLVGRGVSADAANVSGALRTLRAARTAGAGGGGGGGWGGGVG